MSLRNWKDVDCPAYGSKKGQSCGKQKPGAFHWFRTAPHAARKRLANTPTLGDVRMILAPSEINDGQKQRFIDLACALSPENLACDGDLSYRQAREREASLRNQWESLEIELVRKVSETEADGWLREMERRGILAMNAQIGMAVQVAQDQSRTRLGKAKCPGRAGVIVRRNSVAGDDFGGLWYVLLHATNRAKAKEEIFWGEELAPINELEAEPAAE